MSWQSLRLFALLLATLSIARSASAQSVPLEQPNAFRLYAGVTGQYIGVEQASVQRGMAPHVGLLVDYAHNSFVSVDIECMTVGGDCSGTRLALLSSALTAQLYGAFTLFDRLRIGLNVPVIAYANGDGYRWQEGSPPSPREIVSGSSAGLGDPRLLLQLGLLSPAENGGFALSVSAFATAPLASLSLANRYVGDVGVTVGGHVHIGYETGPLQFAAQVGGTYRDTQTLIRSQRGPEMLFGAAAIYAIVPEFSVIAEVQGATSFGASFDNEFPLEARGAVRLSPSRELKINLGGATEIIQGIGTPLFRGFVGATFAPQPAQDTDGDRVEDRVDACPSEAEDFDNHNDEDGCPETDNDDDGIRDAADRCPDQAEDLDQHEDDDGCPDDDDDNDGVRDGYDSCPTQAEDRDGDHDDDGCPDIIDADGDNIADDADRCPQVAEDTDGYGDEDGCPETDFDNDGVPDDSDGCVDQPEDRDRFEDSDGCPEEGTAPAESRRERRHRRHRE